MGAKLDLAKELIAQLIQAALQHEDAVELGIIYGAIEPCPQQELGQYAIKTFPFAKLLKKNPAEVAALLAENLTQTAELVKVEQKGPYINVVMSPVTLAALNLKSLDAQGQGMVALVPEVKHRYLIEHSQPNTHKELHIGHTRNSVLGDSICRFLRHCGHDVHAQNYHGDEGAHVAKCLWYMHKNNLRPAEGENKGTWLGKIYVLSTQAVENASADEAVAIKGEISTVLKQIEDKNGEFYALWKETRQWSLDLFKTFYAWLDVSFDSEMCESAVSERSLQIVEEYYQKGVFVESEGAIGANLEQWNLGFCLLRKSDGRGLYATKDIALALDRFGKDHPDTCVYVVDNRQSYHFKQVFAVLALMGFKEAERCYHLAYDMVETKDGAMSSRKGNIVPILELIKQLHDRAYQIIDQKHGDGWSVERKSETADAIAVAAVRYGMLKVDPEKKITFDFDGWLTLEGNTGPYLQYVYTRMNSLKKKSSFGEINLAQFDEWDALTGVSELQLLSMLSEFNETVQRACEQLKPNVFANYVYELTRRFNAFYTDSPILSAEDKKVARARLALVELSSVYLGKALELMGIPRLEAM